MPHNGHLGGPTDRVIGDLLFAESRLDPTLKAKVNGRFELLINLWYVFCDAIIANPPSVGFSTCDFHMSWETLFNVVIQYFTRLEHYKKRHNIDMLHPQKEPH
ncbi:MAG: hypothetical protein WCF85_10850 [Rhodospirillaceae bacterium]